MFASPFLFDITNNNYIFEGECDEEEEEAI
jgi:hypothetical protein